MTVLRGSLHVVVAAGTLVSIVGAAHSVLNARLLRRPCPPGGPVLDPVSILIPARDETAHIAECIGAAAAQRGLPRYEVVVVDDGSADGTGDIVARIAGRTGHVRMLRGRPPAAGWLGKPAACDQLAATADPTAQILVFLDADVRLGPDAVASTVDLMRRTGLDFATPMPALRTRGRAERLVQPLLPWSVLTFLPVRSAERSARPSLVAAAGPFFAVRRDAYDRAGGHAAVRGEVVEDIALARALRRAGSPGGIVDGSGIATARMYDGWAAVRDGYAKSAWCAFGSPARGVAVMTGLLVAYVAPPAAALAGSRIGAIGYAAGVVSRAVAAHRTGGRLLPDVLAHPASVAAAAWITGRSIRAHRRGTLTWKGRPV